MLGKQLEFPQKNRISFSNLTIVGSLHFYDVNCIFFGDSLKKLCPDKELGS